MGTGRNPFQGGMGFFTPSRPPVPWWARVVSQSLSGWDGVFHVTDTVPFASARYSRNPFQGGMGFFTLGTLA